MRYMTLIRTTMAALFLLLPPVLSARLFVPANDSRIRYFGRWDRTDPHHYRHSWPGVYLCAEFTGTSIGVRMDDSLDYYNVYIDGKFHSIFHGTHSGDADYVLATNLDNARHSLRLSKRNILFHFIPSIAGLLVDDDGSLVAPAPEPALKMEFIGDSFTAAESNEATVQELAWNDRPPVTNVDRGFAPDIARHYGAQYQTICRSGMGLTCDWEGKTALSMLNYYDRTLMESPEPAWNFKTWTPDVVFICLGLNDYSGLKEKDGSVKANKSAWFRQCYHEFVSEIRGKYPGVRILAVAAFPEWVRSNIKTVVDEEKQCGARDIGYATYDEFPGGYVAYGHPTVATHQKMADQIVTALDSLHFLKK